MSGVNGEKEKDGKKGKRKRVGEGERVGVRWREETDCGQKCRYRERKEKDLEKWREGGVET